MPLLEVVQRQIVPSRLEQLVISDPCGFQPSLKGANVPPKCRRALIDRRPPVPDGARYMAAHLIREINRERPRCMQA